MNLTYPNVVLMIILQEGVVNMKNNIDLLWSFTLMNTILLLVVLVYIVFTIVVPQVGYQLTLKRWVIEENQDTLNKIDKMNKNAVDFMNTEIPKLIDEEIDKKMLK